MSRVKGQSQRVEGRAPSGAWSPLPVLRERVRVRAIRHPVSPSSLNPQPSTNLSRGFTLIELLITITIIGILASLGLGALYQSQEKAREINTRTTVYKLHAAMMERWEGYRYRRLPISIVPGERIFDPNNVDVVPGLGFAWRQLSVRRDLMRMELPDRWADVRGAQGLVIGRTPFSHAYLQYFNSRYKYISDPDKSPREFEDCECLYMIMSMGEDTSLVSEQLSHAEAGDKDQDGLPEFWDAWGNPIRFLRWAPGFMPINPLPTVITSFVPVDSALQTGVSGSQDGITYVEEHDPFDARNVHRPTFGAVNTLAYAMYPLIYSSGPDGVPDILHGVDGPTGQPWVYTAPAGRLDPYQSITDQSGNPTLIGQPFDAGGDGLQHLDNIHNHLKAQR